MSLSPGSTQTCPTLTFRAMLHTQRRRPRPSLTRSASAPPYTPPLGSPYILTTRDPRRERAPRCTALRSMGSLSRDRLRATSRAGPIASSTRPTAAMACITSAPCLMTDVLKLSCCSISSRQLQRSLRSLRPRQQSGWSFHSQRRPSSLRNFYNIRNQYNKYNTSKRPKILF